MGRGEGYWVKAILMKYRINRYLIVFFVECYDILVNLFYNRNKRKHKAVQTKTPLLFCLSRVLYYLRRIKGQ